MRKILVPVDGSQNSKRAIDHAASLAQSIKPLTIHLLHVAGDISFGDRSHAFHSNAELERPAIERGNAIVQAAAQQLASSGAEVATEVVLGDVASKILERAEQLGCDTIVMGMRGTSVLAEILMGSTVFSVLNRTKIPVTLVK